MSDTWQNVLEHLKHSRVHAVFLDAIYVFKRKQGKERGRNREGGKEGRQPGREGNALFSVVEYQTTTNLAVQNKTNLLSHFL